MTKTSETQNDKAWKKLFEKYNIQEGINKDGNFIITSSQINEFRQARLMTKFDNQKMLPKLFQENNLTILPISNNNYIIGHFKLYEKIPKIKTPIKYLEFPLYIESINYNQINSETVALNCAYISKILEDFLEESKGLPTVSGKMSSGTFTFIVENIVEDNNYIINVDRTGIEIDAAFETSDSLILIEAKNVIADDFLIRQIYYPYRLWKNKVSKKIRNVFMQYSNGIFSLYEYNFKDQDNYNSLELIKSQKYSLIKKDELNITFDDILNIYNNIDIVLEPKIPFPQADSFERVINLLEILNTDNIRSKEQITEDFQFDYRQTDYYFNAGKYLGFLEETKIIIEENGKVKSKRAIKLTKKGKELFEISYKNRQLAYIKSILEHEVFYNVFTYYLINKQIPKKKDIIKYMQEAKLYNIKSFDTFKRRSSTISGWINWIVNIEKN